MDAVYEKQVGASIRRLREQQCMTQEQLATQMQLCGCDITRSALAKIEVGQRHLYLDELVCIKHLLGTDYETLLEKRE